MTALVVALAGVHSRRRRASSSCARRRVRAPLPCAPSPPPRPVHERRARPRPCSNAAIRIARAEDAMLVPRTSSSSRTSTAGRAVQQQVVGRDAAARGGRARCAATGVAVDARIERGRTPVHALRRLWRSEHSTACWRAAPLGHGPASREGAIGSSTHAPSETLILKPDGNGRSSTHNPPRDANRSPLPRRDGRRRRRGRARRRALGERGPQRGPRRGRPRSATSGRSAPSSPRADRPEHLPARIAEDVAGQVAGPASTGSTSRRTRSRRAAPSASPPAVACGSWTAAPRRSAIDLYLSGAEEDVERVAELFEGTDVHALRFRVGSGRVRVEDGLRGWNEVGVLLLPRRRDRRRVRRGRRARRRRCRESVLRAGPKAWRWAAEKKRSPRRAPPGPPRRLGPAAAGVCARWTAIAAHAEPGQPRRLARGPA